MNQYKSVEFVKTHKNDWDKKTQIGAQNKLFKIVGIGPKALKVLWFGPTPGISIGTWNQCWWKYEDLNDLAYEVIDKMVKIMREE